MPLTVEVAGELEEKLAKLVMTGRYSTMTEAVRDALRHFLDTHDMKEVAVSLYRQGKVSLGLAAEIAELSIFRMAQVLQERGVRPELGVEGRAELAADHRALQRRR
jgi:predicted HTH domain antitoxin